MPEQPYVITAKSAKDLARQLQQLIDDLYNERVAGALIGDVFSVNPQSDILTLELAASGGLKKTESTLAVKANSSTGAVQVDSDGVAVKADGNAGATKINAAGVAVKPSPGKGLAIEAAGLYVVNTYIWPVGSIFIAAVDTNPNTLLGYGTWELRQAGVWDLP